MAGPGCIKNPHRREEADSPCLLFSGVDVEVVVVAVVVVAVEVVEVVVLGEVW